MKTRRERNPAEKRARAEVARCVILGTVRVNRDRYQRIVEAAGVGLAEVDGDGVIVFANARLVALAGLADEPLIGTPLRALIHEADRAAFDAATTSVDVRIGRDEHWVALERTGEVVAFTDIAERKRAERSARDVADLFEAFMDTSPVIAWMKDASGAYAWVNHGLAATYGRRRDEVIGKTVPELVGSRNVGSTDEADARVLESGVPDVQIVETGKGYTPRRVWQIVRFLFWDANGARNIAGIGVDITAQRDAEAAIASIQDQLRQAQKMEAVGRLAGGIAHDFNNILTVILSYASVLVRSHGLSPGARADVDQIVEAAKRAAQLTRQLLSFSRHQVLQPHVLDLDAVIADMRKLLARLLGEDVELRCEPSRATGRIYADAGGIGQVLMNLAVNARDAMPHGGTLTIATDDVVLDEAKARPIGIAAGAYVRLTVRDTGIGMDAATKARLFEPFFTTKGVGVGTGLGLATALSIVQQSGGAITVDSEPGAGATFAIYLPRTDRTAAERVTQRPPRATRGTETVLLVEDDASVRELATRVLASDGYRVLEAASADEALAIAHETKADAIDLVLSDVVMPGMSGIEMWQRLRELRRDMRVLWISGYTDDNVERRGLDSSGPGFLRKPFTPEMLAARVRDALDA